MGLHKERLYSVGLRWGPQISILINSQVTLMLLVRGPHLENHLPRNAAHHTMPADSQTLYISLPNKAMALERLFTHNWAELQFPEPPQISRIGSSRREERSIKNKEKILFPGALLPPCFSFVLCPITRNHSSIMISQYRCYGKE